MLTHNFKTRFLVSTSGKSVSGKTLYVLKSHKLNYTKKSRQINNEDFSNFDFILTMDQKNIADLIQMAPPNSRAKIMLLGEFDPQGEKTIQDPYFVSILTIWICNIINFQKL